MSYLKAIGADNFMGYRKLRLEVEPGLTLIDGVNHHFATASSGGSGKSSLQEVIAYGSFGRTIRNLQKDKVIHRYGLGPKAHTKVWNDYVQSDGRILRTIRYRKHPRYGNNGRLLLDGSDKIDGRYVKDADREIVKRLGFDFNLFKRAVIIHSRMTESFVDVNDKYLKQITEKLIGMPDFEPLLKKVKAKTDDISLSLESLLGKVESLKTSIEEKHLAVKKYRKQSESFEIERKKRLAESNKVYADQAYKLGVAAERFAVLSGYIKSLERKIKKFRLDVKKAKNRYDSIVSVEEQFLKVVADHCARKDLLLARKEKYKNLRGNVCPECGQKVSADHIKNKMTEEDKEYNRLVTDLAVAKATESQNNKDIRKAKEKLEFHEEFLGDKLRLLDKYRIEHNQLFTYVIPNLKNSMAKLKRQEEKNPYSELIKETRKAIEGKVKILAETRKLISKRKKRYMYYSFWRRGFGPQGIRSYILDAVNPVLNRIANIYLDVLMDGNMVLELSTVKLKKTGEYSDKFEVKIENLSGSDELEGSCDNELHSVDFALNLAMSDILESRIPGGFGFLFVDQALDLFDKIRARKALQLLNYKLNEKWCRKNQVPYKRSIWLITHKEEIKGLVENKIMVEKKDKVCRIVN